MVQSLSVENIRRHWQKYRPRMYAELQRNGQLEPSLKNAQELTRDALGVAVEAGQPLDEAWEAVSENWAFLPAESD